MGRDPASFLPHGLSFRFVDRVLELVPGERIIAVKTVTAGDPHLQGHFPGNPIMPGVLLVEMMAQTAGLLLAERSMAFLARIQEARFRRPVVPGDRVVVSATWQGGWEDIGRFTVRATVEGKIVSEAEIDLVCR